VRHQLSRQQFLSKEQVRVLDIEEFQTFEGWLAWERRLLFDRPRFFNRYRDQFLRQLPAL
jgi:phytoene dehydrogenase-like protein